MGIKPANELALAFQSIREFERAVERAEENEGFFFPSARRLSAGEPVRVRVHVHGVRLPIAYTGEIVWRRIHSAGILLPAGARVGLPEQERLRLLEIVRFLSSGGQRDERRTHRRYPIFVEASYSIPTGLFPSETLNLSKSGACLRCQGPVPNLGAQLPVILHFEDKREINLHARISWSAPDGDARGVGVAFGWNPWAMWRLARQIRNFEKNL